MKKNAKASDPAAAEMQIFSIQEEVKYDTRDYPIETILLNYRKGKFFKPPYQRGIVWTLADKSQFIESIFMGLPIPMMFWAERPEDSKLEIVDGLQRISALVHFVGEQPKDLKLEIVGGPQGIPSQSHFAGELIKSPLVLTKLRKIHLLNGLKFVDLPERTKENFLNKSIRVVLLNRETSADARKEIFGRINKSGKFLKSSELRIGSMGGPFIDFVKSLANTPEFSRLCPTKHIAEAVELVTRFFAYSERHSEFVHDVAEFLDEFVLEHQYDFPRDRYANEFHRTIAFVGDHFPYGFKKSEGAKSVPRVRFEAIAVGVNFALRNSPDLIPADVGMWLDSIEFKRLVSSHASNSLNRLRGRIEFVKENLLRDGRNA